MRHYAPVTREQYIEALVMDMEDELERMEQDDRGWK